MTFKYGRIISISALLLIVASLFASYRIVGLETKLKELEEETRDLYQLGDTLRQTSDDLTKMVRMYVVTGEEKYIDYFKEIEDIRNGLRARPEDYHKIYWDLVISEGGKQPRISEAPISFEDMVKESKADSLELELLKTSQQNSDELIELEEEAINAVKGLFKDEEGNFSIKRRPDRTYATSLLYGQRYNNAKAQIMNPILKYFDLIEERTKRDAELYVSKQKRLQLLVYISMGLVFVMVVSLVVFPMIQRGGAKEKADGFFKKLSLNAFESLPIVIVTITAIIATGAVSWWFISELRANTNKDLQSRISMDLQTTYDSIVGWMDFKILETSVLADNVRHIVGSRSINRLNKRSMLRLSQDLNEKLEEAEHRSYSRFVVINKNSLVVSSNIGGKVGKEIEVPTSILDQLKVSPYEAFYLNDNTNSSKTGYSDSKVELIFGKMINRDEGTYILSITPINELNLLIKRSYFGETGELYLINSKGHLITESRFLERLLHLGIIQSESDTSIGLRLSIDLNNPESPLIKSAASVIEGEENENIVQNYTNYLNDQVIGAWKWSSPHGLGVVIEIGSEEAFGAFNTYKTQTVYAALITMVLILMLFSIFTLSRIKLRKTHFELNKTYQTIKKQQDRLDRDLVTGQQVQMSMLPDAIETPKFSIDAILKPAQMVSGDFFDFSFVGHNKDKFYFSVGDVAGKGIPAALFMSATKAMIDKFIDQQYYNSFEIVNRVNLELCRNNSRCVFVTLVLGVVDLKTGKVELTNAGHNPPMIKYADGSLKILNVTDGPVLGIFEDVIYTHQNITLKKGDNIICYTDGVTEAQNLNQEFYGEDRLTKLLSERELVKPKDIIETVAFDITRFIKKAPQFDDITLLSFEYKPRNLS